MVFPFIRVRTNINGRLPDGYDSISSPYRPLVSGKISKNTMLIISITGLLCIGLTVFYYSIASFFIAVAAALGLVTYTPFKRRWWSVPFYNAWIVAVLYKLAYLCFMPFTVSYFNISFWRCFFPLFFGYANFVLTGYLKDSWQTEQRVTIRFLLDSG